MSFYSVAMVLAAATCCMAQGADGPTVVLPTHVSVSKPLSELATMPASAPAPAPVPPELVAKSVSEILATVDDKKPETIQQAHDAIVAKGDKAVKDLTDALPKATGVTRNIIEDCLVRLDWKVDPDKAILEWVKKKNDKFAGEIRPAQIITDPTLNLVLSSWRFYMVSFPLYPVAMMPPEPLSNKNLFVLNKDGVVQNITSVDDLKKFFLASAHEIKDNGGAKDGLNAWFALSISVSTDGWTHLIVPQDKIKVTQSDGKTVATGEATAANAGVKFGDRGGITATLTYDDKDKGKLIEVKQEINIQHGIRPVCQCTKLLDADPIIRKMARQDLLVMGTAAREYMTAQRAKASPELKKAIDEVWAEILKMEEQTKD